MKKKICFVVSSPLTAKAFMMNHFKVLLDTYDICLVANFENKEEISFFKSHNIVCHHIEINRDIKLLSDLKAVITLYRFLKTQDFFAIHSVTPKAGLVAMIASKFVGVKNRIHIFTGQVWHTQHGAKKILLKKLDQLIGRLSTHILVDGHSQRDFLLNHRIISKVKSQVLGKGSISGVVLDKFIPNESVRKEYRSNIAYSKGDVVFGFLGRLNRDKGVFDLLKAFQLLRKKYDNAQLIFIGFDEENVQQKIKETKGVIFYGPTPNPENVLQALDVFCLPSYREGFGTSIIESSLLQLPIICSDTYGLADTIIEGETGLRHRVKDVHDIYKQMEILYLDQFLRKSMGEKGRAYVKEFFPADIISNYWLKFYNNL